MGRPSSFERDHAEWMKNPDYAEGFHQARAEIAAVDAVLARAQEVLGTLDQAKAWLSSPNRALGGRRPDELLDTDIGAEEVKNLLGRIEHGVFS